MAPRIPPDLKGAATLRGDGLPGFTLEQVHDQIPQELREGEWVRVQTTRPNLRLYVPKQQRVLHAIKASARRTPATMLADGLTFESNFGILELKWEGDYLVHTPVVVSTGTVVKAVIADAAFSIPGAEFGPTVPGKVAQDPTFADVTNAAGGVVVLAADPARGRYVITNPTAERLWVAGGGKLAVAGSGDSIEANGGKLAVEFESGIADQEVRLVAAAAGPFRVGVQVWK